MNSLLKTAGKEGKKIWEHFLVFLKWVGLALLLGAALGLVATGFYYALDYVTGVRAEHSSIIWFLPLGGLVIVLIYKIFDKKDKKGKAVASSEKGTNMALAAVNSDEEIPARTAPLIFVTSIISHLFGASVGREGAALQMGASLGSAFAKLFKFNENDKKIMIMAGMSAAFSGIFGAPLTAAIFSMEVISVGVMYYAALVPCVISALTSFYIGKLLGVQYASYALGTIPKLTILNAGRCAGLGILCAALSILICVTLIFTEKFFQKIFNNEFVRIFVAGTIVSLLTLAVGSQEYNGLGTGAILAAVAGHTVWYAFLLKLLFTAISLAGGYKGGEIVPTLFIGATFGCLCASFLGLPLEIGAALGMVGVFCGVTNSPIASFIMGMELFGGKGLWLFAIVVAISYMLSDYYGLYKSQLIIYSKYRSSYIRRKTTQ